MGRPLIIFFVTIICELHAQNTMYRAFPQIPPQNAAYYFSSCEIKQPVKTNDGGYIFSFFPWSPNLHTIGPLDTYTIKTDSTFVPQWRKPFYSKAIVLPTGGIILIYNTMLINNLYNGMCIEKVTQSGVQVWVKTYAGENIVLNDGVSFNNKVRFVGRKRGNTGFPLYDETSQAYTMEMDTSGNFISHSLFNASNNKYVDFSRVKRDTIGNFFVYSVVDPVSASNLTLAKFDSTFNFVWANVSSSTLTPLFINDIDFLPGGNIFATSTGGLVKFNAQGNILAQSFLGNKNKASELCKKPNGNYVVSADRLYFGDSLFLFETDSSMNIAWFKFCNKGIAIGGSVIKNNSIYTPMFANINPYIFSNNSTGNSCMSNDIPFSQITTSVQLVNFTLTPVPSIATISSASLNLISLQNYLDSCGCAPFVNAGIQAHCTPNGTATMSAIGTGPLSWYSTPTGNSFIASGAQMIISSNVPTVQTFYVQDSACVSNPNRTAITVNFYAPPVLSFSPANPSICLGSNVFLWAQGAVNYTWVSSSNPNFLAYSPVINANPTISTIYTVTGSNANNCSDTRTISLTVVSPATLISSPPTYCCIGSSVIISVSGANSYTWSNGVVGSSNTVTPTAPISQIYYVVGNTGVCNSYTNVSVTGLALPSVVLSSNPPTLCVGSTATITASGANSYSWVGNQSITNLLIVAPTTSSVYTVVGTGPNNCTVSASINLPVVPLPTISISASGFSVCAGSSVTLTGSGANTYSWNGVAGGTIMPVPVNSSFIYSVSGSSSGCVDSQTISLTALPIPSITIFTSAWSVCYGDTLNMSASGAISYTWNNVGLGNTYSIIPMSDSVFSVTGEGLNGCKNTATLAINVFQKPNVIISPANSTICAGSQVSFSVSGASNYTWSTGVNAGFITANPITNTIFVVIGQDQNSCVGSDSVNVNTLPLPALTVISSNSVICAGQTVTLMALGANTYSWSSGGSASVTMVNPGISMNYSVLGFDLNNCVATETISIILSTPTLNVTSPVSLCLGSSASLSVSGAASYTWSNGIVSNTILVSPTQDTTYSVAGLDVNNCSDVTSVNIEVVPLPTLTVTSSNSVICSGAAVTLSATGAYSYSWSNAQYAQAIIIYPTTTSIFTVTGISPDGCIGTALITQSVDICTGIFIDDSENFAFSIYPNPNNGDFIVKCEDFIKDINIEIYNALGQLILTQRIFANESQIHIQEYSEGVYYIKLFVNESLQTFKIIKQ